MPLSGGRADPGDIYCAPWVESALVEMGSLEIFIVPNLTTRV